MIPEIALTDKSDDALLAVLREGLAAYNEKHAAKRDHKDLSITLRDPQTGAVIGGLTGRSSLGILFIDMIFLPESLRRTGIGSRVLAMAEEEGRRRGCSKAVLYTISFQAPEFYKRLGWQVFGEIVPEPPGAARFYLTKDL